VLLGRTYVSFISITPIILKENKLPKEGGGGKEENSSIPFEIEIIRFPE
jgi:hypothetical protein